MCTISETLVTTTIINAVKLSIRNPTSNRIPSLTIQVYTDWLKIGAPSKATSLSTTQERMKEVPTPIMVTQCEPARPICLPKNPAMIAPNKEARGMAR